MREGVRTKVTGEEALEHEYIRELCLGGESHQGKVEWLPKEGNIRSISFR